MVRIVKSAVLAASLLGVGQVVAHPGEQHTPEEYKREMQMHADANLKLGRALKECAASPDFQARQARNAARRVELARTLREKRGIKASTIPIGKYKRDTDAIHHWMSISHDHPNSGYTLDTPWTELFKGNASCALVPKQTIGPYFVAGELIREDITEKQPGVPLHVEVQFVDVSNCKAIPQMAIDLWSANSTGVYSGVNAVGQAGEGTTWLRGVQLSDKDGIAGFDTIFPGHYSGRTNHIHVMATRDARLLQEKQQYEGGIATHIGQFYFDESLIKKVEATKPYSDNRQQRVPNDRDGIAVAAATKENDIFMDYAMLGDNVSDGILAWIMVGINVKADQSDSFYAAATVTPTPEPTGGNGGQPSGTVSSVPSTGGGHRARATPLFSRHKHGRRL